MSIDVTNLSFSYGSREILHDLSFSIPDGCLVNVLGPNGVGKSTLFRCILGLSPHYSRTRRCTTTKWSTWYSWPRATT